MLIRNFALVIWISLLSFFKAKQTVPSIAIPRGKSRKSATLGFGQGIVNKIFREIKISFCSELEALTLQLTRPTDAALAASSLDEIIKFLDDEYENTSLLTSVLIKLSRKFMEPNSYTKLKAMLIVHKLLLSISKEKKSFKIVQALEALRKETDEKFEMPFFSAESLENVVGSADTVAEATAVDLAIAYSKYVLDFIDYKAYMRSFPTTPTAPEEGDVVAMEATAKLLCNQIQRGIEVEEACVNCDRSSELAKQCGESQEADRDILKIELKALYEKMVRFSGVDSKAKLSPSSMRDIEATLKIVDPNFVPFEKPTAITATTTTSPIRKMPAAVEESKKLVEKVEIKTATTKKRKEKVVEAATSGVSDGSDDSPTATTTATATAVQPSNDSARTSEIARELAQRSVSRSSSSGSGSGSSSGSSSATTTKKNTASATPARSPPSDTSTSTAKEEEDSTVRHPSKPMKRTTSTTPTKAAVVEQKSREDRKDINITTTKSHTVDSDKANKLGARNTSAQKTSKSNSSTGSSNTKKKGNKKK